MKSIGSNLIQATSPTSLHQRILTNSFRTKKKVVRRSRIERYLDILRVVEKHGPIKQTHIMYKANLSWIELKNSLNHLMKLKFITETDDSSGLLYSISETGVFTILNCCSDTQILSTANNDDGSSKWDF
ncbi:winged helix-turn-helix domain-containing protein [Thermoproteota archaeon]